MSQSPRYDFKIGQVFGKWAVLELVATNRFLCLCECGTRRVIEARKLESGRSRSCGCARGANASVTKTTHGESLLGEQSPEYRTWSHMRERCQKNPAYVANGVRVHSDWDSYERFLADMGRKPSPKHTIDRIDNAKGYEPGNCRWATMKEQQNNKTSNRVLEFNGERMTMTQWAERIGLNPYTLYSRLERMTVEEALTKPKGKYSKTNVSTPSL